MPRPKAINMVRFWLKLPRPLLAQLDARVTEAKRQGLTSDRNAFIARLLAEAVQPKEVP